MYVRTPAYAYDGVCDAQKLMQFSMVIAVVLV